MTATQMAKKFTLDELVAEQEKIMANPLNREPEGQLHIYTSKAQSLLDRIGWAITYHLQEKRKRGTMIHT